MNKKILITLMILLGSLLYKSSAFVEQSNQFTEIVLHRPGNVENQLFWFAQARASAIEKGHLEPQGSYEWLLISPAFDRVSAFAKHYLSKKYKLYQPPTESPSTEIVAQTTVSSSNTMINSQFEDIGLKVQNQTASAGFGETIVVVYNHTSDFITRTAVSSDSGRSWQETVVSSLPGGVNLGDGVVAVDANGNFYTSMMALNSNNLSTIAVSKSTNSGFDWQPATDVVTNEVSPAVFHNKPWIAIDTKSDTFRGNIYVSWTKFDDISKSASILLARSTNGGQSFERPVKVTPDTKSFEVEGSRVAVGASGEVYVTWMDERVKGINFAKSTDAGKSFSRPKPVATFSQPPQFLNGSFEINTFPSIATDNRTIYLTFNAKPTPTAIDKSDVYLVRSTDNGETWSSPIRINNDKTSTDQWMPSVAVTSSGRVGVMWYDRRNDPTNNALIDVYMSVSEDGGKSFPTNRKVTDNNWPVIPTPLALKFGYHGDYNQISARGETFNLNWGDERNGTDPNVYFTQFSAEDSHLDHDFALSARTVSLSTKAGEKVAFVMESTSTQPVTTKLSLQAVSTLPNVSLSFSKEEIDSGNGFELSASVPNDARPGSYQIFVTAKTSLELSHTTTLQLNVVRDTPVTGRVAILTNNPGNSVTPQLQIDTKNVTHMVWQDDSEGRSQIFYAHASDGEDFSTPVNISRSFEGAFSPRFKIDRKGSIHVVWQEKNRSQEIIVYTRSDDAGMSFTPKKVVSTFFESATDPTINSAEDNLVTIVWSGKPKLDQPLTGLFLVRSIDGGDTFTEPKLAVESKQKIFFEPVLAGDGREPIYLAFTQMQVTGQRFSSFTFSSSVMYVRSTDGGKTFSEPFNIVSNFSLTDSPSLTTNGNGTLIVSFAGFDLREPFPSREIYVSRSFDSGKSFTLPSVISFGNGDSTRVSIGLDKFGNLVVVWRDTQILNYDIFLSRLFVGETSFSGPLNISQTPGISDNPSLAIDQNGDISIVWEDDSSGSNNIMMRNLKSDEFTIPAVTRFMPKEATVGDTITVEGVNLADAGEARIGNLSARIESRSNSSITISVPFGAVTGRILVATPTGFTRSLDDVVVTGKVSAVPSRIDFDRIKQDSSVVRQVKITNRANSMRRILAATADTTAFTVSGTRFPVSLLPGQTTDISVTFRPSRAGFQSGRILISTDDSLSGQMVLSCSGLAQDSLSPRTSLDFPRGDEVLKAGERFEIGWKATDNTAIVSQQLLLSTDDGKSYPILISDNLLNQRFFTWTVPKIKTKTAKIKIVAVDVEGNVGEAVSNGNFEIKLK
ncbi:MAG: choice-of-anchor D domain-containing protein [Blastocatellia bacterium]|nr:choice-of-anchor D domain-containing protein [Blastocatellia bacterium]